jgi:hypothetical protein
MNNTWTWTPGEQEVHEYLEELVHLRWLWSVWLPPNEYDRGASSDNRERL